MTRCPWCQGQETEEPEGLCRPHLAEYEGLSVAAMDYRDAEQSAELMDVFA